MENSIEQDYAINLFSEGENIALIGPAGTGKTTLVAKFREIAKSKNKVIAVTALTGCASLLLGSGARTLSSWSGLKVPKGTHAAVVDRFHRNNKNYEVWEKTDILIIDEVSMLSQYMFDILNDIGKTIRNSDKPFGGIQLICIGDFHQLPPIYSAGELNSGNYCFESPGWAKTFPTESHVVLKKIFRQNDPLFQSILTGIRNEKLEKVHIDALSRCLNKVYNKDDHNGCSLPKIMPLKSQCELINEEMFAQIQEPSYEYHLVERSDFDRFVDTAIPLPQELMNKCRRLGAKLKEQETKNLRASSSFPEILQLKKGACVMCTVNLDMENGICNGSIGTVVGFVDQGGGGVVVKFSNGVLSTIFKKYWQSEEYPTIVVGQLPLILAWAITIHKSQGATLPMAEINVGNSIFAAGQVYVAVSRVKSLEGLYLTHFSAAKVKVNPKVKEFYKNTPVFDFEYDAEEEDTPDQVKPATDMSEDLNIKIISFAYK